MGRPSDGLDCAGIWCRGVLPARGAACFTWDDAFASDDTVPQMANARGLKHTLGTTNGFLGNANRLATPVRQP